MITIQKISVQGNSNVTVSSEQKLQLTKGEALLVEYSGVKSMRNGADLLLLIPTGELDSSGQEVKVKVWVTGFFTQGLEAQVLVTSADEPVQMITPDSISQIEDMQNAQATDGNGDIDALNSDSSQTQLLASAEASTASTQIDLTTLQADNEMSQVDFLTTFTKGNDTSIVVKLPGINPPSVPTLNVKGSGLLDPFGYGVTGVNKQMSIAGYSVQGTADRNNEVTLVLQNELTKNTVLFTTTADGSGEFSLALSYAKIKGIAEGYYTLKAYATDAIKAVSPDSNTEKLYIDVKSPDTVKMDWGKSDINLSNEYINRSKIGEYLPDCKLEGTAEANSTIKFTITDSNGKQNLGSRFDYSCRAGADGKWNWALSKDMMDLYAQGILSIKITATDAMQNESNALVFGSVGFDLIAPTVPEFQISLDNMDQADGEYLTLNKSSLNINAINNASSKDGYNEKDGKPNKVQLRFISEDNKVKLFESVEVDSAGRWSKLFTASELASLAQGVYKVSAQGTDASGNKSEWSDPQTIFVDVSAPEAPTLTEFPVDNKFIDIDGSNLSVVNLKSKNDTDKKFAGKSEALSTVILTLYDSNTPNFVKTYKTQADANGLWSLRINSEEWSIFKPGVISAKVQSIDLSNNSSKSSDIERIYLDIIAPPNPTIQFGDEITQRINVKKSDVRYLNYNDFESGKRITGTGEQGSTILLTVTDDTNTVILSSTIRVNSFGTWQYTLRADDIAKINNGPLVFKATSTDISGNPSETVTYTDYVIEKHASAPDAPKNAGLLAGEDTASPDASTQTDKKTNKVSPKLTWTIQPGLKTYIWADQNKNGRIDDFEKDLSPVDSSNIANGTDVVFSVTPSADGEHDYYVVTQDEWGNFSSQTQIQISRDTQISNPKFSGFGDDNNLSYLEYLSRKDIKLRGTVEEENSYVTVRLLDKNGDTKKTSQVKAENFDWTIDKFFDGLVLDANGTYTFQIFNIDSVGNSTENKPLEIKMNIRSSPLNDVGSIKLSAATDSGNARDGTGSDNVTKILAPEITGHVDYDPNAETIVVLKNSRGVKLGESAPIGVDGSFSFRLDASWLLNNQDNKFTLSTFDKKTGTDGNVPKDIIITIDSTYDTAKFSISNVTDDNLINFLEFSANDKPKLEGTSETNSEISIKLSRFTGTETRTVSIDSSKITYTNGTDTRIVTNSDPTITYTTDINNIEHWSAFFTEDIGDYLGNGEITMVVTAKDRVGNEFVGEPKKFTLSRSLLDAPDMLDLDNSYDTGASNTDNKTQGVDAGGGQHKIKITGKVNTPGNVRVVIWNDANKNSKYEDSEKVDEFIQSNGRFERELTLADGQYTLYNFIVDDQTNNVTTPTGKSSSSSDPLTVFIDNSALKPTNIKIATDSKINLLNFEQENATIKGEGEKDATVYINFELQSAPGTRLLNGNGWSTTVNSEGKWNINLSQSLLSSLQEGKLNAFIKQTDPSNNSSPEEMIAFEYDKTPPGAPDASSIEFALNSFGAKPWEDPNGIDWNDIYSYDSNSQQSVGKTLRIAVALPTSGSLVQANDTLNLFWGQSALTNLRITDTDVTRGYVIADVGADVISREGKNNSLTVKGYYTDSLNNKSSEFNVLTNINVSLNAKSPTLDISQFSSQSKAPTNAADKTWYSNQLSGFEISGVAEPGSTVNIYSTKLLDNTTSLLRTVAADSVTGKYSFMINDMRSVFAFETGYALQAESVQGAVTSIKSDAVNLKVFKGSVSPPSVNNGEQLATDNAINSSERDAGVTIAGTGAPPFAKIQIKLINQNTNVAFFVDPFYAKADGTWSHQLGILDWGGVGEGRIKIEVNQTNLYGDSSGFKILSPTYTYDATVAVPVIFPVATDNFINKTEYQTLTSSVIELSGTGEPLATLTIKLTGSNGYVYEPSNITVTSQKTWQIGLSKSIIDSLGEGKVVIEAYQTDSTGNKSATSKNTSFTIDTTADNLTINNVAGDNIINPVEKEAGVLLSGTVEANSTIEITLSKAGYLSKTLQSFKPTSSNWSYTLKSADIHDFGTGEFTITIKQTDQAQNTAVVTKTVSYQTGQLGAVSLSQLADGQNITLAEQAAEYAIRGTAPTGSQVRLQFKKPDNTFKEFTVDVDTNGNWVLRLSTETMVQLQGQDTLRYWAVSGTQSSDIQTLSLVFESNFSSPSVKDIAGDNVVTQSELVSSSGDVDLTIEGSGENDAKVNLVFKGSANAPSITRSVDVENKSWTVSLTKAELIALTNSNGTINYTIEQIDQTTGLKSTAISKSFTVDLLAPAIPVGSELDAANKYNNINSGDCSPAADKLITDAEAREGVKLAVPIAKNNGNFVMAAGDKVTIIWGIGAGQQTFEKTLTQEDFVAGKDYVIVKVPSYVISKYGQSSATSIGVKYTDKVGNSSDTLLIDRLTVNPPPDAPTVNAISGDGYLNNAELFEINSASQNLTISGSSKEKSGKVNLIFYAINDQTTPLKTINDISVDSNTGNWSVSIAGTLVNSWSDGQYVLIATYTSNGRTSNQTKSIFELDRVSPDAPTDSNTNQANIGNSISELGGGLTRPWINGNGPNNTSESIDRYSTDTQTEAMNDVNVRVPLPGNVKVGDVVVLTWGADKQGVDNKVIQAVSNSDIAKGVMTVKVPASLITAMGDDSGLTVKAKFIDSAQNSGESFDVVRGKVVDAAPLPVKNVTTNFGDWLNLEESNDNWFISGNCEPNAEIEIIMRGSNGYTTDPIRLWKNSASGYFFGNGTWKITKNDILIDNLISKLGEGLVNVSIVQRDEKGNPSKAVDLNFRIDLTPPGAPAVDTSVKSKLTFSNYASGKTVSGENDGNAKVFVFYELLNTDGTVRFTTTIKEATVSGTRWTDVLDQTGLDALKSKYDMGTTGGKIRVNVFQTDQADNKSAIKQETFSFESQQLDSPTFVSVDGLDISTSNDTVISASDFVPDQIVVRGKASDSNLKIRLVLTKNNVFVEQWDIDVDSSKNWSQSISKSKFTTDSKYNLSISSQKFDSGFLDNESLVKKLTFNDGSQDFFTVDTRGPLLISKELVAQTPSGNAKLGDKLKVILTFSETIVIDSNSSSTPEIVLKGFSDGVERRATYARINSSSPNQMEFEYTVEDGAKAVAGSLSVDSIDWGNSVFKDVYGNLKQSDGTVSTTAHTILIDTEAPNVTATISSISGTDATSSGGSYINISESASTVVRVGLTGEIEVGNYLILEWDEIKTFKHQITAADKAAGSVAITIDAVSILGLDRSIEVKARVEDAAQNKSSDSSTVTVNIDTLKPPALRVDSWLTDNLVNEVEFNETSMPSITGTGGEDGSTLAAKFLYTSSSGPSSFTLTIQRDATDSSKWSIEGAQIKDFLSRIHTYGKFDLQVSQTDARGNTSEVHTQSYFIDKETPNKPTSIEIEAARDGWLNANEANNIEVRVNFDTNNRPKAGDKINIKFWKLAYLSTDYTPGQAADFERDGILITQEDLDNGYRIINISDPKALQDQSSSTPQKIKFEAKIIDQGGNPSSSQSLISNLDTNITTPVVSDGAGTTDSATLVVNNVNPTQAQGEMHFKGSGIEVLDGFSSSTNLKINFTSKYGKISLDRVAYDSSGKFDVTLNNNDFRTLVGDNNEALVYYEVYQIDKSNNVSNKAVDSFTVALSISAPVVQNFSGDNILNKNDLTTSQTLSGVAVPKSDINIKLFVVDGSGSATEVSSLARSIPAISNPSGSWSISYSPTDLTALTASRGPNFKAYFEVVASQGSDTSLPTKVDFEVYTKVPSFPLISKFDANRDGANNDGLEITFDDDVRVSDMLKELNSFCGSRRSVWGSNFKIEAKDETKISGDLYARTFRISLGADRNISSANTLTISRSSIVNKANNQPSTDVVLSIPSLKAQVPMSFSGLLFGDNYVNANEINGTSSIGFRLYDDTPAFKPTATDRFTIYLDGKAVTGFTNKPLTDFTNFTSSTNWFTTPPTLSTTIGSAGILINSARQGNHTLRTQITSSDNKDTGYYSAPHTFIVDTVADNTVKSIIVSNRTGTGDRFNEGDRIRIEFAEPLTLSQADLNTSLYGVNASVRPLGGFERPVSIDNINRTTYSTPQLATDAKNASMKSSVWEITLGSNPSLTKGTPISFSSLNDVAENSSSIISTVLKNDAFDTPTGAYIDVVSKDNVITSADLTGMVKIKVQLTGAKPGDIVKLYMDGTDASNLVQPKNANGENLANAYVTVTDTGFVEINVDPKDFGADGLRNLVATVQRPGGETVIQSDGRNVYVSENSTHWSATGKMIWFDTDNIVQETGSSVSSWQSSVGGSTATSVGAPTAANPSGSDVKPVLIRNAVNGHNQLFFNGSDFQWNATQKKWVKTDLAGGKTTGTYMYFDDPERIFATVSKSLEDSVVSKIPYTVIANGRKDTGLIDSFLTSIGANGTADNKLATGNVGLAYFGDLNMSAYQGGNTAGGTIYYGAVSPTNRPSNNNNSFPYLAPGVAADLGFSPFYNGGPLAGTIVHIDSGNLGTQLLLSHTYNTEPTGTNSVGDVYFYSNGQLIGHRVTDYKITLGGGSTRLTDQQFDLITKNQFLIGATNQANTNIGTDQSALGKNVTNTWRGMIGDIIWAAKHISGAYLEEINTYQAVKFATTGYFMPPQASSQDYDLAASSDKLNLLDDVLLLNQYANAGNGKQTITVAGADFVNSGNGNDVFILKDLSFRYLDGGKDEDTLKLASDYAGSSSIYLSDYVSNSRGDSSATTSNFIDNARVNVNGFHKLAGIENIDLSTNTAAQTLLLTDKDVYQLSDTHSLKIILDRQDVLLVSNMNTQNNGHYFNQSTSTWYDYYYAQDSSSIYTKGGDKLAGIQDFELINNNTILNINFDHALKTSDGSALSASKFSVKGLGSYAFASDNITDVSFFNLQQSIRFTLKPSTPIKGPISITYSDTSAPLKDAQGRDLPSLTWMIGSDLADFDSGANYVLNASSNLKPVIMLGGGGEDQMTASNFDDTLAGGYDSDTMTGGVGSDTFLFFKESSSTTVSNIGGAGGDVITDFGFGKNGAQNADTIKLDDLFASTVIADLGKGSVADATTLDAYLKFEWTRDNSNLQLVCSADLNGGRQYSKLFTLSNLKDSIGAEAYDSAQPNITRLYGGENTSNAILQKLLEEGRMVIQ